MSEITIEKLNEWDICRYGKNWFLDQQLTDGVGMVKSLMTDETQLLIKNKYDENSLSLANWLIVRLFDRSQCIMYACFAARQVLPIFEKKYPDDRRPRNAIEAAEKCIREDSEENRKAAAIAAATAFAAYADADADADADAAANAAANAAAAFYVAANSDAIVDSTTYAGTYAAIAAYADAAADSYIDADAEAAANAASARKEMQLKILNYGLSLLCVN